MNINFDMLKKMGLAATVIGGLASFAGGFIESRKTEELIKNEVAKAMAAKSLVSEEEDDYYEDEEEEES